MSKILSLKVSMKLYQCPKIKIKTFGKIFFAFSSDITHFWDGVLLMNMTLNQFCIFKKKSIIFHLNMKLYGGEINLFCLSNIYVVWRDINMYVLYIRTVFEQSRVTYSINFIQSQVILRLYAL